MIRRWILPCSAGFPFPPAITHQTVLASQASARRMASRQKATQLTDEQASKLRGDARLGEAAGTHSTPFSAEPLRHALKSFPHYLCLLQLTEGSGEHYSVSLQETQHQRHWRVLAALPAPAWSRVRQAALPGSMFRGPEPPGPC